MLVSEAAQYIKDQVPTASVLSLYGYSLSRDGFMRCPFHAGDHTASLKVYDSLPSFHRRGWFCFGCHAGGSVLDFVMLHDSCSFVNAVRAVDQALNLNLLSPVPWQEEESYRLLQSCLDDLESVLLSQLELERRFVLFNLSRDFQSWLAVDQLSPRERSADDWTRWYNLREGLLFLEDRLSRLDAFKEEVLLWRSKHRRRIKSP